MAIMSFQTLTDGYNVKKQYSAILTMIYMMENFGTMLMNPSDM
jgi:hypothetical protein